MEVMFDFWVIELLVYDVFQVHIFYGDPHLVDILFLHHKFHVLQSNFRSGADFGDPDNVEVYFKATYCLTLVLFYDMVRPNLDSYEVKNVLENLVSIIMKLDICKLYS
jgi:hypothetical protein